MWVLKARSISCIMLFLDILSYPFFGDIDSVNRRAFTLVELLVVISIIALLVSMLVPTLSRIREMTRRTVCGANLHNLGLAVTNYYIDNERQLMCSQSRRGGSALPSHIMRTNDENWVGSHNLWLWNIESIDPYVGAFGGEGIGGAFMCPSAKDDYWTSQRESLEAGDQHLLPTPYAYYARVNYWQHSVQNGAVDELTDNELSYDRLLMSDHIWWSWQTSLISFNHGSDGPAMPDEGKSAPPPLSGINHLYGDGSVRWKDASQLAPQAMGNYATYPTGYVGDGSPSNVFYY